MIDSVKMMSTRFRNSVFNRCIIFIAVVLFFCMVQSVQAAQLSTSASFSINGTPEITDLQSGTEASYTASVEDFVYGSIFDWDGPAYAVSSVDQDGSSAIEIEGMYATGQPGPYGLGASASWEQTVTNTTGVAQKLQFSYDIGPASLEIIDWAGADENNPDAPQSYFSYGMFVDNVDIFSGEATLRGGNVSHVLTNGTGMTTTFYSGEPFGYYFEGIDGILDLGILQPGESLTFLYKLSGSIQTGGYEIGAAVRFGDPWELETGPGITGDFVITAVPIPGGIVLLLSGIIGLITIKRKETH